MTRPFILGLTGSIGMGKSTTSRMFADAGIPVWDADATVHHLYSSDTPATRQIAALVPHAVTNHTVDRQTLKAAIAKTPVLLSQIEAIVAPLVSQSRQDFIKTAAKNADPIVIIDHPLLFESGSNTYCDAVLTVTTTPEDQKSRVMARGTMSETMFQTILAKQMPDTEKRKRADFIIHTTTLDSARDQVQTVIAAIETRLKDKPNA